MHRFDVPATIIAALIFVFGVVFAVSSDNAARPSSTVKIEITEKAHDPFGNEIVVHGTCSGVYLGNGVVLTAKHCTTGNIVSADIILDQGEESGAKIGADVLWQSDRADIAAYRLKGKIDARPATLACRAPNIGEQVEIVGNPLGQDFIHTWGKIAGVSRSLGKDDELGGLGFEVPVDGMIASGNSGGPVYDGHGYVLGISNVVFDGNARGGVGQVRYFVSSEAACGMYGPHKF